MKTLVKILSAIVGLALLSVAAVAAYIVLVLDPNDYKPALIDVVKQKTDMELRLDGQLAWQLYPSIGLSLGEMALRDPQLDETLLAVKQAAVSVKLMPLFGGEAQINAVNLEGAAVRFVQLADGKTSWDHLLEKLKSPEPEEPSQPVKFDISQLLVTNTELTLEDRVAKVTRKVSDIHVEASDIGPNQRFPLLAKFVFSQSGADGKSLLANNEITADINVNMDTQKPEVFGLAVVSALSGNLLPAPIDLKLSAEKILADVPAKKHQVDGLVTTVVYKDPARKAPVEASVAANIVADLMTGQINVAELSLGALGLELKGKVNAALPALASGGDNPLAGMKLSGELASNVVNPRELMQSAEIPAPQTASADVLKKLSVTAKLQGNEQRVLLSPLTIKLDGSTLTGEAGLSDLTSGRLFARLSLDQMNVDNYLPPAPAKAAGAKTEAPKSTTQQAEALLPVELLRGLNLDATFTAGALTIATYPIQSLRLAATAKDGLINVSEFQGRVADGSFSVPVIVDVRGKEPVISLKPKLDRINLGPIAQKALNKDVFDGRMSFNGAVTVRGNDADTWMRTAQGPNTLRLDDGVIKGVNVTDAVFNALGQYQALLPMLVGKDVATLKSDVRNTEIASMLGEMTLNQGEVRNQSMKVDLKDVQVGGSGTYNLITQDVDYRFQLKLDPKFWGEKNKSMAQYPIPVRCNGNLKGSLATLCGLDQQGMQGLVQQVAKARLTEEVGKQQERLQEKLNEKLKPEQQEAVKQLFQIFQR